jgi:hypothetical protein
VISTLEGGTLELRLHKIHDAELETLSVLVETLQPDEGWVDAA